MCKEQAEEIAKQLNETLDSIRTLAVRLIDESDDLQQMEKGNDTLVVEEKLLIQLEADSAGKKKFSNQDMRDAELSRRLSTDKQYQNNTNSVNKKKTEIEKLKVELRYLENKQRNIRTIASLLASD